MMMASRRLIENEMGPIEPSPRRGTSSDRGRSFQPPAEKIMHDGMGRNHRARRSSGDDEASRSSSHTKNNERADETLPVPAAAAEEETAACHDYKVGDSQVSGALLARLFELRASAPRFVDTKRLHSTDARSDQNRLQIPGRSPLSRALTDSEKALVSSPDGMSVTAFDRGGYEYGMMCKLWNEKHYRFMGQGWKDFWDAHLLTIPKGARLTRRVTAELWAFRSRALPPPKKGNGGEELGPGHPDGVLGLVVLLRDDDDGGGQEEEAVVAEEAAPEESDASMFLLLMAAVALQTLGTRDRPKGKHDDN